MNKKIIPLLLAGSTLLVACNQESNNTSNSTTAVLPTISKEDAVAVVNGQYVSKESLAALESEIAQRGQGQSFPKEKLVEELVQRELLIQDAAQKKLDQTPAFQERMNTIKNSLLSQAAIENYIKSNPITDADLKAAYDEQVGAAGTEYKARHILVKSEDEAKQLIVELGTGADFAELAKAKSTGPSGPQGGDLGWFAAGQMVAPFSEAVSKLEDNKFTLEPVKTQFGYHVILREGSRAQTPPPFESVKEQLKPMLQREKMQAFLASLRQQATVEVLLPAPVAPTPEVTAAPAPATTEQTTEPATESAPASTEKAADQITDAIKTAVDTVEKVAGDTAKESTSQAAADEATKAVEAVTK